MKTRRNGLLDHDEGNIAGEIGEAPGAGHPEPSGHALKSGKSPDTLFDAALVVRPEPE